MLKVPVHRVTLAGTSLVGVFTAGNSNCLLLPPICFEEELEALDKLGIKYEVIQTKLTAIGNNILANDNGALINPDFEASAVKQIKEALKVPVKEATIGGYQPGDEGFKHGQSRPESGRD